MFYPCGSAKPVQGKCRCKQKKPLKLKGAFTFWSRFIECCYVAWAARGQNRDETGALTAFGNL